MKKFKIFSLFLLFAFLAPLFAPVPAAALEQPPVQSAELVLADAATGNVLFSQGADTKAYPAAATQIMTVLLAVEAVENGKAALSDAVTVTADGLSAATSDDTKTVALSAGETTTLENLLYCAMLSSSADACAAIAQRISGGTQAFVEAMNARAKALGCTGTNFTNVSGAHNANHYTTAGDLAKIAREAYSHQLFMQICGTISRTVPATNASDERALTNCNGLLNQDAPKYGRYFYQYASGMKAGVTAEAGYCLVSSAAKNGVKLICVALGGKAVAEAGTAAYTDYADTQTLFTWAFDNFEYREVIKMTENVKDVAVKMGREADTVAVHPEASVKVLVTRDEDISDFTQKITIYSEEDGKQPLTAPIEAGAVLGEISAERDGTVYGTSKLLASNSVDLSYGQYLRARMAKTLLTPGAFLFFGVVIFLIVWYCAIVARYRRRVAAGEIAPEPSVFDELPEPDPFPETTQHEEKKHRSPMRRRAPAVRGTSADEDVSDETLDAEPESPSGSEADADKKAEEQAERDYFADFFGNKINK